MGIHARDIVAQMVAGHDITTGTDPEVKTLLLKLAEGGGSREEQQGLVERLLEMAPDVLLGLVKKALLLLS